MRHLLPGAVISLALLLLWCAPPAQGQSYINQEAVEDLLNRRAESLDALPEVYYDYHVLDHPSENRVLARSELYKRIGDGDVRKGRDRSRLVELLNRVLLENVSIGDTLVIPTEFELDFRAYSPFPRYYPGARELDKLFIIHKNIQAWAAYEFGKLVRWGPVNTGSDENPTPNGRFNFNWKQEYRISTLSPPDEDWEMYWVFNFHHARGIHIHQYPFPTGGPTSRGCVRLIDADARWIYHWADHWETTNGHIGPESGAGRLLKQGTMVLVLGGDPEDDPQPFDFKNRYPVLRRIEVPDDPYDVPPGSPQQERFDAERTRAVR